MEQVTPVARKPLWRRIVDFPLVAMLVAIVLVFLTSALAAFIADKVPPIAGFTANMRFGLICAAMLVLVYELVIRHLGEHPRDDYRDPRALRRLLIGLGAGFAVFSLAVAVAAALGIYRITGKGDLTDLLPALISSAIFPAVSEELLFRGILFRWIEEFGGSWAALLLTSAFFGAAHLYNPNASTIAAVGIAFEAGVMLGAAYMLNSKPVASDGNPRGVELRAGRDLRHPGVGHARPRRRRSSPQRAADPHRKRIWTRSLAHRDRGRDAVRPVASMAGDP